MTSKSKSIIRIILFLAIAAIYFFTRFQNLTSIPVFGDEAIYVRWSQIIKSVETLRFIPVTDGKQPLYMWLMAGIFKLISDPLVAGRTISIFAGFGTLLAIFITTCVVISFKKKNDNVISFIFNSIKDNFEIGLLSSFIYVFLPFSFFFDRMALPDNLLAFFGIVSILLSLLNAKYKRLDLTLILGGVLGLAWLTKSPAIFFIALSAFTVIFFNYKNYKSYILAAIASLISFCFYNILRLGPQFNMISLRNKDYVWPITEILKHPLDPLKPHIFDIFHIYNSYISLPIIIFSIIGFLLIFLKSKQNKLNLSVLIIFFWWILPLIADAGIAKVFTARYILYTLSPLIILLSIGIFYLLTQIKNVTNIFVCCLALILLIILNANLIYKISLNPKTINLPSTEVGYISDWTSGWGIKDASTYLKSRTLEKNVIVGTEGYFGTLPDGLMIYTQNTNQLTVFGVGLEFTLIPEKLTIAKNYGDEVYLLINQSRLKLLPAEVQKLTLIKSYDKPNSDKLLLYKL